MAFYMKNGWLYCESLCVKDIHKEVPESPFYLYSANQIKGNYKEYEKALTGIDSHISYAVKANGNLTILKILRDLGSWATLVSGNEIKLALKAGFPPEKMIYNGNGKTLPEVSLAANHGIFINIDSLFDLDHISQCSKEVRKQIPVLLRINPEIDPSVHPYIATGRRQSKFGIPQNEVPRILGQLSEMRSLNLVGLHCHLGSTIRDLRIFQETMSNMVKLYHQVRAKGFKIQYLNLGGGLGIDYSHQDNSYPNPTDLVMEIKALLPSSVTLILEPGRSMVGNAGILVCKVVGVKKTEDKNFIVIDGSMTELIRPSLYQAYHHIESIEPLDGETILADVVGPVCESTDFLGKERSIATPKDGTGIAIFDTGAYGYAMSSNYNGRDRPAEYLVDRNSLFRIRRAENIEDQLRLFEEDNEVWTNEK